MKRTKLHPHESVVLITGAGSGIGAATALRYAELGATVLAVDIDEATADRTAELCRARGAEARSLRCDVAVAADVDQLAKEVHAEFGAVDVLVNNAGVGVGGPFLAGSLDDWVWLRSINLDGVVHGCRAFAPAMIEAGRGHVVNVASGAAYVPSRRTATYCASKAAVVMLSTCLRADWAGTGVGVSVICPGVINTPIVHSTRLRGSAIGDHEFVKKVFSHSHPPEAVATAIVNAVARNRAITSVGVESRLLYHAMRILPAPVHTLIARV